MLKRLMIASLICLAMPAAALAQNATPTQGSWMAQLKPPTKDSWIARVDPAKSNPWPPPIPKWGPTVHYKGPRPPNYVPAHPGVPLPKSEESDRPHLIGLSIDGYDFGIKRGWCSMRVQEALYAHQLLLTGNRWCDRWIRQARYIQQQKELEDPSYADEPRITPAPTPVGGDEGQPGN
jgi:hypothetical protein